MVNWSPSIYRRTDQAVLKSTTLAVTLTLFVFIRDASAAPMSTRTSSYKAHGWMDKPTGMTEDQKEFFESAHKGHMSMHLQRHFLDQFNKFGNAAESSDLPTIYYNDLMAHEAQAVADQCDMNSEYDVDKFTSFPSIASTTWYAQEQPGVFYDWTDVMKMYTDQKNYFDFKNRYCKNITACGELNAIFSAQTTKMGCGIKYCEAYLMKLSVTLHNVYQFVCFAGQAPPYLDCFGRHMPLYTRGANCTRCLEGFNVCDDRYSACGLTSQCDDTTDAWCDISNNQCICVSGTEPDDIDRSSRRFASVELTIAVMIFSLVDGG